MFDRLRAAFARVFTRQRREPASRPAAGTSAGGMSGIEREPDRDTGIQGDTDVFLAGWAIEATARSGGHADPYTGRLPNYVHTTEGRVIVSFTYPSGDKVFRTIHGPLRDDDPEGQIADLIIGTVMVVSPA